MKHTYFNRLSKLFFGKLFLVGLVMQSFTTMATNYYVDSSVSSSGDGLSWATAFKTIQEAADLTLAGGDIINIKPGAYVEEVLITSNGTPILPITAGVSVSSGGVIQFPSGTNLSAIDLTAHPGEYFTYVARSWKSNNGVYKITSVNDAADQVTVEITGDDFLAETGTPGDLYMLSAAIVRPVVYKNSDPTSGRVTIEAPTGTNTVVMIGDSDDGYNGDPANYNRWDGIDIAGPSNGFGMQIVCSMYNTIVNSHFYDNHSGGIIINGRTATPASYNYIQNCELYDDGEEILYIGSGGHDATYNTSHFTHIIDCEIYQTKPPVTFCENALDFKEFNTGCVFEGNLLRDIKIGSSYNGLICVFESNTYGLIYGNEMKNISSNTNNGYYSLIVTYDDVDNLMIFNNIMHSPGSVGNNFYPLYFHDNPNINNAYFAFNTITGFNKCMMQDGGGPGMYFTSNIFDCNTSTDWGNGNYNFDHNIFKVAPSWGLGTDDVVGSPGFVTASDFHLSSTSIARDAGAQTTPIVPVDFDILPRDVTPDIGAFEYQNPLITVSTTTLPAFPITNIGHNSAAQSFTASGTGLTANITVTAPSEFEISTTEGSGYGTSLTLTPTGGTVANTTIYVRFSPTTTGMKTGNIILSSTGAADVNVAVSGEAIFIPPTPTITTSTNALTAFPNTNINGHSTAQNFTVSGTDIISGIGISAPTHFEISITEGSGYSNTLFLYASGNTVPNTTIYVRFSPTTTGMKTGNIVLSSTGATSRNVAVSGEAFPSASLGFNCSSMRPAAASVGNSGKAESLPVYGSGLLHDVIVTGSTNFEVSLNPTSGFGNQVTLTPAGDGTLNTDIYVRCTPQTVGDYHEYIFGWYNEAPGGTEDAGVPADSYGFAGGTTVCNWFGSVNSDWSLPLNWDNVTVPPTSASVFITKDASCNSSGSAPTINPAIEASVAEIRSPAAYPATLTVASDATGTGSLIVTNSTSYTNFVVNRYLPGAAQSWHMVGAPLNNVAIGSSNFNPGGTDDLYAWHEPSPGTWVNFKNQDGSGGIPSFPGANGDNNFHPGKGYLVAYDALNPVKQFSGQNLVTGNVGFTLSRAAKKDWTYNSGWNLLANPYTSGIDWNLADRSKFEDNYVYVYDPNKSGGEGYTSVNGGVADAFIGIGQGFMVKAKSTSNGQVFNFTSAMQKHGGDFMKAPASNNNGLTLRLASLSYYNETSILLDEAADFNRDRNDALKLFSFNPEIPQLYSFSADGAQLDINSIPSIEGQTTVDLGLKVVREDSYEISLIEQTGSMTQVIYLEDKLTGEMHNLTQHSYSFAAAEGQIDDRFTLHFGVTGITTMEQSNLNVYCVNSTLHIAGETGAATLDMFDLTGKRLSSNQVIIDGHYSETIQLTAGIYFVRISNNHQITSAKILVQ